MSNNDNYSPLTMPENPVGSMLPELMANLMRNLPGMAYRCKNDDNWSMLFLSEGCNSVTGYTAAELLNNTNASFNDLIHVDDREYVRRCVDEAIYKRTRFQMEYRIIGKGGGVRWVWEQGNAIYNADNSVVFLDGYIAEISSRKQIEEKIKHVAKDMEDLNATKDKFFSLIAHDLQNPVYAILSLSEFLVANIKNLTSEDLTSFATQIQESAKGIYTLLENLLDWTKSQTGKIQVQSEYLSLTKLIAFLISQLQPQAMEKNITVNYEGSEDVIVDSDSHLITTILRNLFSNAIKYSHPNSVVTVNLMRKNSAVQVEVLDNGIGISRRNLGNIFRIDNDIRFPGTKRESGSGLGLILAKDFADKLGAQLSVASKLGKGSIFTFSMPEKYKKP